MMANNTIKKALSRIFKLDMLLKVLMKIIYMFIQSKFNISSINFHL